MTLINWPYNQKWHEGIQFPGNLHTLEINADSYNDWVRKVCKVADPQSLSDQAFERGTEKDDLDIAEMNKTIVKRARANSDIGWISKPVKLRGVKDLGDEWRFGVKTLPYYAYGAIDWLQFGLKRNRLAIYENDYGCYSKGAVMFTGPVHIPMLAKRNRIWMSLTPMEIFTLREGLSTAKGHVLVAGLGMGWLTQRILESPKVTKVTQLELIPEIIEFFGRPLKEEFGDKIDFINADVYDYLPAAPEFDTYIFDIWPQMGDALDDEIFQNLSSELGSRVWGWGDAEMCDDDEPEYEEQDETDFPNDQACWDKEEPHEWWGLGE